MAGHVAHAVSRGSGATPGVVAGRPRRVGKAEDWERPAVPVKKNYFTAMVSISTRPPMGSVFTAKAQRAGLFVG